MQKKRIFAKIFAFLGTIAAASAAFCAMGEGLVERNVHFTPSYPKAELADVLARPVWDEEDYLLLFRQTGLSKAALLELRGDNERILAFQEAFFREYGIGHERASAVTQHDILLGEGAVRESAPLVPLQDGDVLVSSSCHSFGWRNGHAAIVTNAATGITLESVGPGIDSAPGLITWFQEASNFLVLRLKDASVGERKQIADHAAEHLNGVPYSIFTGIFSSKDQGASPKTTHCSHLVWQAYHDFGYEIDPDGGPVCTPRDIANCDLFEVIQVFGFDPDLLWK